MEDRAAQRRAIVRARRLAAGLSAVVVLLGAVWQGAAWILRERSAQTQDAFFDVDVWVQTNSSASIEALYVVEGVDAWLVGDGDLELPQRLLGSTARQLRVGAKSVPTVIEGEYAAFVSAVASLDTRLAEPDLDRREDLSSIRADVDRLSLAARDFHVAGRAVMVDELRSNVGEQRSIADLQWVIGIVLSALMGGVLLMLRRNMLRERALLEGREDERRRTQEMQVRHAQILESIASAAPTDHVHDLICSFARDGTGRSFAVENGVLVGDRTGFGELTGLCDRLIDTVTARDESELTVRTQAMTDPLTGLLNRKAFVDRLDSELARWRRQPADNAVLLVDLDRFKSVNDLLGHAAGDELLVRISEMLRHATRDADVVSRLGGDEFVCLLTHCDRAGAEIAAERIAQQINGPVMLTAGAADVSMSVGIVAFDDVVPSGDRLHADDVLHAADLAMYHAKRERLPHAWFVPEIALEAERRIAVAGELRRGLLEGEIVCHYQPVIALDSGRILGVEALARWRHGDELRYPGQFIDVAEEHGLIGELGDAVLRRACGQLAQWREIGLDLTMAVNVSGLQLRRSDFVSDVAAALADTGIDGRGLILEVTESVLLSDKALAVEALSALRDLGIEVAIDDFGTGYSSLASLQDLPIDILKIDRSFVSRLGGERSSEIVSAIVALATALQLRTIAEGIETEDQVAALIDLGCDEAQGYLFARPADPADLTPLLLASEDSAVWNSLTVGG